MNKYKCTKKSPFIFVTRWTIGFKSNWQFKKDILFSKNSTTKKKWLYRNGKDLSEIYTLLVCFQSKICFINL